MGTRRVNLFCFLQKKWLIEQGPAAKFLDVISPENVSYWPCISFSKILTPETLMSPISKDEELICHGHEVSSCEVHAVQKSNGVKALQSHALHLLDAFNCPFQRFRAHEIILRKILPVLTGQGHTTRNEKANKEPSQRTIWSQDSTFDFRCVLDGGDSLSTGSADDAGGWDALSLAASYYRLCHSF